MEGLQRSQVEHMGECFPEVKVPSLSSQKPWYFNSPSARSNNMSSSVSPALNRRLTVCSSYRLSTLS